MCDLRGGPAPVQCPAAVVPLLLIPSSSSEVVHKKVHRHPTHLTLQHTGERSSTREWGQREGMSLIEYQAMPSLRV